MVVDICCLTMFEHAKQDLAVVFAKCDQSFILLCILETSVVVGTIYSTSMNFSGISMITSMAALQHQFSFSDV